MKKIKVALADDHQMIIDGLVSFLENEPDIEVIGIGTNLTCLYGVLPNSDKLIQLSLYEQLIEAKFNKNIPNNKNINT